MRRGPRRASVVGRQTREREPASAWRTGAEDNVAARVVVDCQAHIPLRFVDRHAPPPCLLDALQEHLPLGMADEIDLRIYCRAARTRGGDGFILNRNLQKLRCVDVVDRLLLAPPPRLAFENLECGADNLLRPI